MTTPKEIVIDFYNSDFANDSDIYNRFVHPNGHLNWNSSKGFSKLNSEDLNAFLKGLNEAFVAVRFDISHMLAEENFVTTRYTVFVKTIENPDEEVPIAHFISIWEVQDGKLYAGYEISQPADDSTLSLL